MTDATHPDNRVRVRGVTWIDVLTPDDEPRLLDIEFVCSDGLDPRTVLEDTIGFEFSGTCQDIAGHFHEIMTPEMQLVEPGSALSGPNPMRD